MHPLLEIASTRRARIAAVGAFCASVAISAWAWQAPGPGNERNAPTGASPQAGAVQLPAPIYTSRPTFRIPFQIDQQEISRLGASEIRLYASGDGGAQWHHVQSVDPTAKKFNFKASGDGEYWFTVQTLDRNSQLHPGGPVMQPGLVVIVDSTRPSLELSLQQGDAGQVQLSWIAVDEAVDGQTLTLEYSQTGSNQWQSVAVIPAATGQTSWSVPLGGVVSVRGSIRDRAGNEVVSQATVQVTPTGTPTGPDLLRSPIAENTGPGLALPPSSNHTESPLSLPPDPIFSRPLDSTQATPPLSHLNPVPAPNPLTRLPLASPNQMSHPGHLTLPGQSAFNDRGFANSDPRTTMPAPGLRDTWQQARTGSQPDAIPRAPGIEQFPGDNRIGENGFGQTIQPGRPYGGMDSLISSQPGVAQTQQPTFRRAESRGYRTVRSRKFQIDYAIDDVGPSGVSSVELYVTQNNGEKWYRYGIDEDRQSPFEVEVPGDGLYGFAMRVVSGAGLVEDPPSAGQRPDIMIVSDASPPVVNMFPLQQGTGRNSNRILITWEVQDRKLADQPVSLSYSANADGPWEPIADWMANSGQYIWTVDASITPRLYVRLTARDEAGNIAQVETPQPVLVDLARPTARIVDVESSVSNPIRAY